MFACVYARDNPDMVETRKETIAAHRAHLDDTPSDVRLHCSGPLLEGGVPCGSLFIYEADDSDRIVTFVNKDPNVVAGIYRSIEILEFDWRRGAPE